MFPLNEFFDFLSQVILKKKVSFLFISYMKNLQQNPQNNLHLCLYSCICLCSPSTSYLKKRSRMGSLFSSLGVGLHINVYGTAGSHNSTGTVLCSLKAYLAPTFTVRDSRRTLTNKFHEMYVVQRCWFQSHAGPAEHRWQPYTWPEGGFRTVYCQMTRLASTGYCVDSPCTSQHQRSSTLPPSWPQCVMRQHNTIRLFKKKKWEIFVVWHSSLVVGHLNVQFCRSKKKPPKTLFLVQRKIQALAMWKWLKSKCSDATLDERCCPGFRILYTEENSHPGTCCIFPCWVFATNTSFLPLTSSHFSLFLPGTRRVKRKVSLMNELVTHRHY